MRRLISPSAVAAALALVVVCGLAGCGFFDDDNDGGLNGGFGNLRPRVTLTAAPPEGDTTRYEIDFHWTAWDYDGKVDYFVYCTDPPDSEGADTVWVETEAYSVRLTFTADDYDTTTTDQWSDWTGYQIGLGYHVFVIKAVDNRGAMSAPECVAFNAATICPRTYISSPPPCCGWNEYQGGPQTVGLRVTFRWWGEDLDGFFSDVPVGYEYKLTDVTGCFIWKDIPSRIYADPAPWVRVGPGTSKVTLALGNRQTYGFGVRAIDEASAVEPLLVLNRNLLWILAKEASSSPELTVSSTAFGSRHWSEWTTDVETYDVPVGSAYELTISGDAGWYGGLITGYSFGWDLEDLQTQETHPDGIGAWTPWSTTRTSILARFTQPRDYYLFVKCKDDMGGMTLATIRFDVATLTATKKLGYIDDWRMYPHDAHDDRVWQGMLEGYDYGEGWTDLVWDEWNAPYGEEIPPLEFLSRFEVIVWSMNDYRMINPSARSAWYLMNLLDTSHVLAVYMGSRMHNGDRGKVWAFGRNLVEGCVSPNGGLSCGYPYEVCQDGPQNRCCIRPGSFAYDYMHIRGDYLGDDPSSGGARVNMFSREGDRMQYAYVNPDPLPIEGYGRPPAAEIYPNLPPRLEPDFGKYGARSLVNPEVLEYPRPEQTIQLLFYDPWVGQETGLIPVYRYKAAEDTSKADGGYCGFRYIPRGSFDHGEIVYFMFPMYPIHDDQARMTARVVLSDWFGLPDPDASGDGNRPDPAAAAGR